MCLINGAHEHFITQTGKKSKQYLKILWGQGRGVEGRLKMEPRAEENKYPINLIFLIKPFFLLDQKVEARI